MYFGRMLEILFFYIGNYPIYCFLVLTAILIIIYYLFIK